jgi:hypothetical protein
MMTNPLSGPRARIWHVALYFGRKERRAKLAIAALPKWAAGLLTGVGANVQSFGKQYRAVTAAITGGAPPSHLGGQASDGGVTWQFVAA